RRRRGRQQEDDQRQRNEARDGGERAAHDQRSRRHASARWLARITERREHGIAAGRALAGPIVIALGAVGRPTAQRVEDDAHGSRAGWITTRPSIAAAAFSRSASR